MKYEKIVKFTPAFDKRTNDPHTNYGIGSVNCFMVLKGKNKAAHFIFSTGIFKTKTMQDYTDDGLAKYENSPYGVHYLNKPYGMDVGYHSIKKNYKGQAPRDEKCQWLDNKNCYCDGSALLADEYLQVFINEGSDKIWEMLEEYIKSVK